jgi:hypothetical protein
MRFFKLLRDNSLSLALFALFAVCLGGSVWTGWLQQNEALAAHRRSAVSLWSFLGSGTFVEGMAVNWQAAVLQLASLIVFSSFLYQRGSPHSRKPSADKGKTRRGGRSRHAPDWLRRNSLFIAFAVIFLVTFAAHAGSGFYAANSERALRGEGAFSFGAYLASSTFWWETFQTWQAEYLVIALYLVLSVFLRQHGSAESKPDDAPDGETGEHNE